MAVDIRYQNGCWIVTKFNGMVVISCTSYVRALLEVAK